MGGIVVATDTLVSTREPRHDLRLHLGVLPLGGHPEKVIAKEKISYS